jgi:signal peptidase I
MRNESLLLYLAIILLLWLAMRRTFTIITVNGQSMEPTLFAGGRVLRLRLRLRQLLQPGQFVVC